jgi:hypothetical protein
MAKANSTSRRDAAVTALKELFADKRDDLTWHHEVGRRIMEVIPERKYGAMQGLIETLGGKEKGIFKSPLYSARDFFLSYRRKDLSKLNGLTYFHVCLLLKLKNTALREKLRRQCQEHGWSTRQLGAQIKEAWGRQSRSGPEFEPKQETGPRTTLDMTVRLQLQWEKQLLPALERNYDRLANKLRKRPDDELMKRVDDAYAALGKLEATVKSARLKLKEIRAVALACR